MSEAKRYFLELAYNGTRYHGWQIQLNAHSIQEELEKAISILIGSPTPIMGSGRTDTGVHASQQFAHFDTAKPIEPEVFLKKLNAILPKDIAVYQVAPVKTDAHARFSATWRSYVYQISLRKSPFLQESHWIVFKKPDLIAMNAAAALLLKHEDFECFSKVHTDVNTFNCKIKEAFWEQNDHELLFHITANRFLRGMVRAIVGTLMEVGYGKLKLEDFQAILDSRNRNQAKASAPAQGLYLCRVAYPEDIFI